MNSYRFVDIFVLVLALGITTPVDAIAPSTQQLYWQELVPGGANGGSSADDQLRHAASDGTGIQTILTTNANGLSSIAELSYVPTLQKLYWGSGPNIFRANLDGSNLESIVSRPTSGINSNIQGLAFDLPNSTMYWADSLQQTITKSDLNGANRTTTVNTGQQTSELLLDRTNSRLIFVGLGDGGGPERPRDMIERVNLDGTGMQTLVSGIVQLTAIDIDPIANKLYWVDLGYNALNDTVIRRSNLDGTGVETLLSNLPDVIVDMDVDYLNSTIYWTSRDEGKIKKSDLNGGNVQTILSGLSEPQAILVFVPEPGTATLLLGAIPILMRRRR
jgi:hypothetical protein